MKCTGMCGACGRCAGQARGGEKAAMLVFPPDWHPDEKEGFGLAVDIGTTTIAATLWDLRGCRLVASGAEANPQGTYGADVISRITACQREAAIADKLTKLVLDGINSIMADLCQKAGIQKEQIEKAVICGNTTMSHLFAGYSPVSLAKAPFDPAYKGTLNRRAAEIGLATHPDADVTLIPNIAGHVGGDITAGILAVRLFHQEGLTLYIDIGTNGEIVLADGEKAYACSTSAGPALEGASITCGTRAGAGAIERVEIENGQVRIRTIEDGVPTGICGSGIIDAVAQMLDSGVINKRGRMAASKDILEEQLKARLLEEGKARSFQLAKNITITQSDIREVQLVKAAIKAGTFFLLEKADKMETDLEKVIVAGAFGNHINVQSAVTIGLLPDIGLDKIFFMGNSSGAGCAMALVSEREQEEVQRIPGKVTHVDLAAEDNFQEIYLRSMGF